MHVAGTQVHHVSQPYWVLIYASYYRALNTRQGFFFGKRVFFLTKVLLRGGFKSIIWTKALSRYCEKGGTRTPIFFNCPLTLWFQTSKIHSTTDKVRSAGFHWVCRITEVVITINLHLLVRQLSLWALLWWADLYLEASPSWLAQNQCILILS